MKERRLQANVVPEDELWASAYKRLVLWAMRVHRAGVADAEDMVQEAIRQFLAAGGVANPADPQGLLQALGSRINGVAVNRRRKKADLAVRLTDDGNEAEPAAPSAPEERVIESDTARRAVSALLDRVDADELVFGIVSSIGDGVEDAADQARLLGRPVQEVYNARRRLKVHVEAVAKIMEDW